MDNCRKTKFIRQTAPSYSDITEMERLCSGSGTIRERPAAKKGLIPPTFYSHIFCTKVCSKPNSKQRKAAQKTFV